MTYFDPFGNQVYKNIDRLFLFLERRKNENSKNETTWKIESEEKPSDFIVKKAVTITESGVCSFSNVVISISSIEHIHEKVSTSYLGCSLSTFHIQQINEFLKSHNESEWYIIQTNSTYFVIVGSIQELLKEINTI